MVAEIKLKRSVFWAAGFSAVMIAGATPALAGFGYTGSMAAPAAPVAPAAAPSPATGGISWDNGPLMPAQKVQGIEAIPLMPGATKKTSAAAQGPDFVSGFGKDLPLLVALQQVVPPQYKVSLAPGVDGNKHVSWQGEKPWEQVLSDMLAPSGLVFALRGNTLVVKSSAGGQPLTPHVASSRNKIDMIPDDMIASGNNAAPPAEMAPPPPALPPTSSDPISMVTHSKPAPAPLPEANVAPEPAPVAAYEPPPAPPAKKIMASAPAAPETPVIAPAWHASRGQTLRTTLADWSKAAHVQLYWSTDYDYKLNSDVAYGGSFEEAVGRLFDQFSAVKPQPYGQLHKNPETGVVLVVNTYGTYN